MQVALSTFPTPCSSQVSDHAGSIAIGNLYTHATSIGAGAIADFKHQSVSARVNTPKHDDASLMKPIGVGEEVG